MEKKKKKKRVRKAAKPSMPALVMIASAAETTPTPVETARSPRALEFSLAQETARSNAPRRAPVSSASFACSRKELRSERHESLGRAW